MMMQIRHPDRQKEDLIMSLRIEIAQLNELLHDFNTLTGIKIVIFDDNSHEELACPARHCDLCKLIRSDPNRDRMCEMSNSRSFETCRQSGGLFIYKCHAGLIEATAPIKDNGVIIGYIMFGQITDSPNKEALADALIDQFSIPLAEQDPWEHAAKAVKYKNIDQIKAAGKILEALTLYVLQKNMVSIKHVRLIDKISRYIDENIDQTISVKSLAAQFNVSRTVLYELTRQDLGMGIGSFLRKKRMEKARQLLLSTDTAITAIANQVGFDDSSYFAKAFKQEFNMTPSEYRIEYGK